MKLPAAPLRILVIDDDTDGLETLADILAVNDYVVITAANGADGLARAQADAPDLFIVDLVLPVLNGFEVITRLRQDEATRTKPIIAVTAAVELPNLHRALEVGADYVLEKPFTERAVLRAIHVQAERITLRAALHSIRQQVTEGVLPALADLAARAEALQADWAGGNDAAQLAQLAALAARARAAHTAAAQAAATASL